MEKVLKSQLSEANWQKVKEHVVTSDGAPQIAPASSSKPAIAINPEEIFDDVSEGASETLPSFLL